ncbi:MAG TPA: LysM domain-containing protein, partial [Candidatus Limnocylindrales bacterium]
GAAGRAFADPGPADPGPADPDADDLWSAGDRSSRSDEPVQRNPPRDWAAPPPWLASAEGRPVGDDSDPPSFLSHRSEPGAGLAGSAADQLAGGPPPPRRPESGQDPWAVGGAAVAGAMGAAAGGAADPRSDTGGYGSGAGGSIPAGGGRDEFAIEEGQPNRIPRRPRAYDQHLGGPADAPDWERPRRYEAYPTIKTRVGMPGIPQVPRLALTAGVVAILALALFFLPGLLNLGGSGSPSAPSASPSARPSQSVAPTPLPAPTPQVYTIKKGDTLSKIAKANGLTLQDLLDANPDIKNPNKVAEGQQIVIPAPGDSEPADAAGSPEGSAP